MSADSTAATSGAGTVGNDGQGGVQPGRRWVKMVLGVICLFVAGLWVYALFFASKESINRVDDRAWAERADGICAAANDDRAELIDTRRIDEVGPGALAERADIIDTATDIVESMLDDVVAVTPTGVDDVKLVDTWEAFYRQLIDDRRRYSDILRTGENPPFSETAREGAPITEWINDFTVANEMKECSAPPDLSI